MRFVVPRTTPNVQLDPQIDRLIQDDMNLFQDGYQVPNNFNAALKKIMSRNQIARMFLTIKISENL